MNTLRIPIFVSTGKDTPRENVQTITRETVFAIIESPGGESYTLLDRSAYGWKTFIIGGIEAGESPQEAALREILEETGYDDISSIQRIGPEVQSLFYAAHKGINRQTIEKYYLVKLHSLRKRKGQKIDTQNHEPIIVGKNEVGETITVDNNKYIWRLLVAGIIEDEEFLRTLPHFKGFR